MEPRSPPVGATQAPGWSGFIGRNARNLAFAQVVDLLERLAVMQGHDVHPLGTGTDPRREALNLSSVLEMVFHGSPVDAVDAVDAKSGVRQPQVRVAFFGLGGPHGPLPEAYLELVLRALYSRDGTAADFLDLFHHRLLALLYRTENEFRIAHPFRSPHSSPVLPALDALTGAAAFAPDGPEPGRPALRAALLAHADLASRTRRSMCDLLTLLSARLGVAVKGEQWVGCWRRLPPALQTVLGSVNHAGSNDVLGRSATVGTRAWNQNAAIALTIDALAMDDYLELIPGGVRHDLLVELLDYYLGPHIACRVDLTLAQLPDEDDPIRQLGHPAQQLGYVAWLGGGTQPGQSQQPNSHLQPRSHPHPQQAVASAASRCSFWRDGGVTTLTASPVQRSERAEAA